MYAVEEKRMKINKANTKLVMAVGTREKIETDGIMVEQGDSSFQYLKLNR